MTLYLKYRPQTIDELDLASVRETLKKLIRGEMPHAFLFSGPKGTGKTSAARIIAKAVNCLHPKNDGEPCNRCESCQAIAGGKSLDVIELDAASNRGIDEVRALRESVGLAPISTKKKVYIIDEAHMLTSEAANALLKTLEEPPSHVIFILATTDPQKLPATVASRLTHLPFKKATPVEIERQLSRVIKGEGLKVEKGVIEVIADSCDGSFRDAVKILETASLSLSTLSPKAVEEFLFQSKSFDIEEFISLFSEKKAKVLLDLIEKAIASGVDPKRLLELLVLRLREALLATEGVGERPLTSFSKSELIEAIELLGEARRQISVYPIPQLSLELAVVKWCQRGTPSLEEEAEKKIETREEETKKTVKEVNSPPPSLVIKEIGDEVWHRILAAAKTKNTSIEALLRAAKPLDFNGQELTLGVFYEFHKERLETPPYKVLLEDAVSEAIGTSVRITCRLTARPQKVFKETPEALTESGDVDIIEAAKEIFGS